MPRSPYRIAPSAAPVAEPRSRGGNRDVAIPLALFWCVSVLYVALAFVRGEAFDTGAAIALVAVIALPVAWMKCVVFAVSAKRGDVPR